MAFWALGALDKVKGITEKLTMKDVGNKLISYVVDTPPRQAVQNDTAEKHEPFAGLGKTKANQPPPPPAPRQTDEELMRVQLAEYRKLTQMQENIVGQWRDQQRAALSLRQHQLEQINQQLIAQQQTNRKQAQRDSLFRQLHSGEGTCRPTQPKSQTSSTKTSACANNSTRKTVILPDESESKQTVVILKQPDGSTDDRHPRVALPGHCRRLESSAARRRGLPSRPGGREQEVRVVGCRVALVAIVISAISMWLMWITCYMHQMYPLISPKIEF